jgi:type II secretion system protein H
LVIVPGSFSNRRAKAKGFTLIELMIVIVLIAIMTGVIVAEMRGTFEDALLRATARKLMDAANIANARAVAVNEPHLLTLDLANHRYSIHHNVRDEEEGLRQVSDLPGGEGELDERVRIELRDPLVDEPAPDEAEASDSSQMRDRHIIRFMPDGTADASEILLVDRAGGEIRLRMSMAIARWRVVEATGP